MTIVNAAAATEAVFISQFSNQFDFDGQGAAFNSATQYSWDTSGGDDVQVTGGA